MQPMLDHIHLTVENLERAERFYDAFLPLVGFDLARKERDAVPAHAYELVEYHSAAFSIGLVSPRAEYLDVDDGVSRRRPGALHHLAFRAQTRGQVDAVFAQACAIPGAQVVHRPQLYPTYCPDYYAFFIKDSEGVELEVCHFERARYF